MTWHYSSLSFIRGDAGVEQDRALFFAGRGLEVLFCLEPVSFDRFRADAGVARCAFVDVCVLDVDVSCV